MTCRTCPGLLTRGGRGRVGLAADQHDASLIVLGSHGRSGLTGAFVGSLTGAVAA